MASGTGLAKIVKVMQLLHSLRLPLTAALVAFGLCAAQSASAADALIDGGKLCTQQFPVQEKVQRIPTHLLAAISTTESGRWHKDLGMAVPWPWTINVAGKGYYFNNKAEAIARVQQLQAQGVESIDVGCMQVNLKHHRRAFSNLNEAFDPQTNVAYAAKFLRDNYADLGDWIKATAAYHSRTEARGKEYLVQIERSWNRIVTKVAAARASQGNVTTATAEGASQSIEAPAKRMRPIKSTHGIKVVKVDERPVKNGDVLIIHGPSSAPEVVASAAPVASAAAVPTPAGDTVRRVALDNGTSSAQRSARTQPKFVFVN